MTGTLSFLSSKLYIFNGGRLSVLALQEAKGEQTEYFPSMSSFNTLYTVEIIRIYQDLTVMSLKKIMGHLNKW